MKHFLVFVFIITNLFSCTSQESIIIEKKKINWQDYPDLFTDNKQTTFNDNVHFFRKCRYV